MVVGVGIEGQGARINVAQRVDRARRPTAAWLVLVRVTAATRYLMVVQGASTMSSWSMPIMFAPLGPSTPMTRKATFWMRISLPTGDSFWNSSRFDGFADQADLVPVVHVVLGEGVTFVHRPNRGRPGRRAWCRTMKTGTQLRLP